MIYLNGQGIPDRDELGEQIVDDSFLLLINAHHQPVSFTLPDRVLRTHLGPRHQHRRPAAGPQPTPPARHPRTRQRVPARAMHVLQCRYR